MSMRKLCFTAAIAMAINPVGGYAAPPSGPQIQTGLFSAMDGGGGNGRLFYKKGLSYEIPEADVEGKLNVQYQGRFTFTDYDSDSGREDVAEFDNRRVRLILKGHILNRLVSYKVSNDFQGGNQGDGSEGNDLKDAWIQLNHSDLAKLRFGQMKTPHTRQYLASSANLQFIDRSIVTSRFAIARNKGVMLHGRELGPFKYAIGVFNGESDGEGSNLPATDNNVIGVGQLSMNMGEYGSRKYEGDFRGPDAPMAMTIGASGAVGQAEIAGVESDTLDLNADFGMRCHGGSFQGEFFYESIDPDNQSSEDTIGFYVQVGKMIGENWEPAVRFGYIEPDDDVSATDDIQEYSGVVNYYVNGHALKIQTGVTWERESFRNSQDLTDLFFMTQVSALI